MQMMRMEQNVALSGMAIFSSVGNYLSDAAHKVPEWAMAIQVPLADLSYAIGILAGIVSMVFAYKRWKHDTRTGPKP